MKTSMPEIVLCFLPPRQEIKSIFINDTSVAIIALNLIHIALKSTMQYVGIQTQLHINSRNLTLIF